MTVLRWSTRAVEQASSARPMVVRHRPIRTLQGSSTGLALSTVDRPAAPAEQLLAGGDDLLHPLVADPSLRGDRTAGHSGGGRVADRLLALGVQAGGEGVAFGDPSGVALDGSAELLVRRHAVSLVGLDKSRQARQNGAMGKTKNIPAVDDAICYRRAIHAGRMSIQESVNLLLADYSRVGLTRIGALDLLRRDHGGDRS